MADEHTESSSTPAGDEEVAKLIASAQTGDGRAFSKIVTRYEDRIYRFGYRMCGHPEDAREVLQDTFLAALRHIEGYRGDGRFVSWLYKIASSACLKKRRLKKGEPEHTLSLDVPVVEEGTPLSQLLPADEPTPYDEAHRSQLRDQIMDAVRELPEHYRIVLLLRDFEHQSTEEVAKALGLTETATKVRLHRARLMLRERLVADGVTPPA